MAANQLELRIVSARNTDLEQLAAAQLVECRVQREQECYGAIGALRQQLATTENELVSAMAKTEEASAAVSHMHSSGGSRISHESNGGKGSNRRSAQRSYYTRLQLG